MKRLVVIICFLVFVFNGYSQKIEPLESDSFCELIDKKEDALILDVRVIEMYKKNRIKNAVWAGRKDSLTEILKNVELNRPLLLYCEIGKRSKECAAWLKETGYTQVFELKGGLKQWIRNGYPVDSVLVKE